MNGLSGIGRQGSRGSPDHTALGQDPPEAAGPDPTGPHRQDQPATTSRSRGASLSDSPPVSVHTTMSSMRAP
jgi:hypothetical protein